MTATADPHPRSSTSRLPSVGTTIFTVMSALAQQHGAVNLGQGFPDFDCDPRAARRRRPRDARGPEPVPADGRRARRCARPSPPRSPRCTATATTPAREITITAGATQAILTAILAIVHPGDEVIVLDPCYDSYEPNIELAGGTHRARAAHAGHVPAGLRRASPRPSTPRTRAIVINTPHNPSATVWSGREMQRLADLLRPTDVLRDLPTRSTSTWSSTARAPERGALARAGAAQLHRLELRQDLPRDRLEGRLRRRAGRR